MSTPANSTSLFSPKFPSLLDSTLALLDLKSWYPSPHRTIAPRPWFLPITFVAFTASMMLPRSTRLTIATPALLLLISQTRVTSFGKVATDFAVAAFVFGCVLKWIDYGMLVKEGELYKVGRIGSGEKENNGSIAQKERSRGVWQRFKDALELLFFNLRGIGWNWRVGGIPERSPQSKSYFLFRTALRLALAYLELDIVKSLSAQIPYIYLSPRPPFFAQPILIQVLLTWLHQLEAFVFFNIPYQLPAFLCVATNYHFPSDWPPLFGNLSDAYLVSRAWGRTWHQLLRRSLGLLTPHAQRWLGAKSRGSKRTVSLCCSFFMSGLAHWAGALNLPWTPSAHGMFTYFMMQAPVIRVEDYVVDFGKARGIKGNRLLRWVGYVWTFAWISFSMRYAAAYQFESGPLSKFEPLKFSLIQYILAKMRH